MMTRYPKSSRRDRKFRLGAPIAKPVPIMPKSC